MEDTFLIIRKSELEAAIRDSDNSDRKIAYGAVLRTSPSFSLPAVQAAAREIYPYREVRGAGTPYIEDGNKREREGFMKCFQWLAEQSKKGKTP